MPAFNEDRPLPVFPDSNDYALDTDYTAAVLKSNQEWLDAVKAWDARRAKSNLEVNAPQSPVPDTPTVSEVRIRFRTPTFRCSS
jgi:hypothetical protein